MNSEFEHYNKVAALGCYICKAPAEIHHKRTGVGMRQKAKYYECIPLCERHHRTGGIGVAFHAGPKTWQEKYGIEDEIIEEINRKVNYEPNRKTS